MRSESVAGSPQASPRDYIAIARPDRRLRYARVHTVGHIVSEMGKLYRQARKGEINSADASRLASILALMRQGLEASELERRLMALETGEVTVVEKPVRLITHRGVA